MQAAQLGIFAVTSDAGALLLGEVDRALIAVVPLYQKRPFMKLIYKGESIM
jgi:hypothetical protein